MLRNAQIKTYFDDIGFRWFTHQELVDLRDNLSRTIHIGVTRPEHASHKDDDGVAAFPSRVVHITEQEVSALADDAVAITAACGGTNWIFTLARHTGDGKVILEESLSQPIPESARQHTCDSLMELIADNVVRVARQYSVMDHPALSIAISFGFPQVNIKRENGDIDARITQVHLPKKWVITDCDEGLTPEEQPSLADMLREKLLAKGVQNPGAITIINDTVAVALDVQHADDLPMGFVFGTGTNASLDVGGEKGIVNLESGHAQFPQDEIWRRMEQLGYVSGASVYEHWMGGGMLPYRIAAALSLISDRFENTERWAQMFLNTENQALISHLAAGNFSDLRFAGATEDEKDVLRSVCRRALTQAGQVIGIMIASVVKEFGYEDGKASFLYEGSLMNKGYEIKKTAMDTLDLLVPGHELEPTLASGMIGVAKLAMVHTRKHHILNEEMNAVDVETEAV